MLYEIGKASEITQGVSPSPWKEDIAMMCGPWSNRRSLQPGEINIHC